MLTDFKTFGIEHILSLIIPIIIGLLFIFLSKKYPDKKRIISIILAILIVSIRSVRYAFDINLGVFSILDLFSLHICNIDLILLAICLFKPNKTLYTFNFLIGIPTALLVALMPGKVHPDPGMLRAIFFIMSHMMLVMGAIYLKVTYKYEITKKNLYSYYLYSIIGIIVMYIFNILTSSNFMYLVSAPEKTILATLYNTFGPVLYVVSIYMILMSLVTSLYFVSKIKKLNINY